MSSFEGYQEVDSYWYDQVPSYWGKTKNKYVFCQNKHVVGENWEKFTLLTMGKSGVKPRDMNGGGKFPASFETYQTVEPNQLIFCLFDLDETPRTIGMSKDHGMITSAYDVFSTTEGNNSQFWTYFYQMIDDHKGLRPFYTGLRKVVKSETFMGIEVFSPPLEEQKLISRYLDKKTEQIDYLIEKIQKKIELLKEQRTSLINQCVTKGLDPNVEMKDSGVEWIGEIPKHWSLSRLDFLVSLFGRVGWKSLKSDEYVDDGYVFLSTPNIKNKDIDFENVNYITKERYEESPEIMLEEGNVLLVKDGSTLGITNIVRSLPRPSTVNSSIGVLKIKSKDISPDFLYWYLSGHYIQNIIQRIKGGMGVPHLFQSDIKKFFVLLPSRDEQEIISKFVNKETSKLDLITEKHHERIRLLKEYRQSFISSAVTGKVLVTEDMI